jgi:hypothetical protein
MRINRRVFKERRKRIERRDYSRLEENLDKMISSKDVDNKDIQDWSLSMVLIESDVEALYPILDAGRVAEII